jgi:membrane-associated phospholipid phosphatase/predicted MFS family arabinose efflux permease
VIRFLAAFSAVAVGLGAARALTTAYVPVLLDEIEHNPGLIGAVMLVNAVAGFAVPLGAGWWSDRRGTRFPFILGGALVAGGGLAAIALGTASTYFALTLAAAAVYIGLNAATTAHRAVVAERFEDEHRPRATGAQEIALLLGALLGTVGGGVLVESAPELLFVVAAVVVPLLALPTLTLRIVRERRKPAVASPAPEATSRRATARALGRDLVRAARTPGAREVLAAQVLWVFAYVALAPFMVLYAEDVLDLGAAAAGLILAAFGLLTGAGMLAAGALKPERVRTALIAGTLALGAGLVLAVPASSVAVAAAPFALAAVGAGVVTALGFPYYARFIPDGEAGAYSGVFFSGRAIASAAALPSAGGLVAASGSYRALLGMGGTALVAAIPLSRAERAKARPRLAPLPHRSALREVVRAWAPRLGLGVLGVAAVGVALPALQGTDEAVFRAVNGLGQGPDWLYQALDPHSRNYAILVGIALVAAAFLRRGRYVAGAAVAMLLAAFGSDAILEPFQILFDRPRPEEALGAEAGLIHGRTWAHIASFPSGHLMVTAAMVAALIKMVPRLTWPLLVYLFAIAITRVTFGAHFPIDVVVGGLIGWEVGVFSVALVRAAGLLPGEATERAEAREPVPASAPG